MSKIPHKRLQALAEEHGTPLVVVDHEAVRQNYATFKRRLPRVQAYYAVKANPAPEIVQTLYKAGASFDVASFPEFMLVYELIRRRPARERQDFVWDKIVYANPVKAKETLEELNKYKPLVTFDNRVEIGKIGPVLLLAVPTDGGALGRDREHVHPPFPRFIVAPGVLGRGDAGPRAALSARLYRAVRRPHGPEIDLAIAACAINRNARLWSANRADFADIPGLTLYSA